MVLTKRCAANLINIRQQTMDAFSFTYDTSPNTVFSLLLYAFSPSNACIESLHLIWMHYWWNGRRAREKQIMNFFFFRWICPWITSPWPFSSQKVNFISHFSRIYTRTFYLPSTQHINWMTMEINCKAEDCKFCVHIQKQHSMDLQNALSRTRIHMMHIATRMQTKHRERRQQKNEARKAHNFSFAN